MGRVFAVVMITVGTLMVGFNPNRFDKVLFDIPLRSGHGVHLHDILGMLFVAFGTLVLWVLSGSRTGSGPRPT